MIEDFIFYFLLVFLVILLKLLRKPRKRELPIKEKEIDQGTKEEEPKEEAVQGKDKIGEKKLFLLVINPGIDQPFFRPCLRALETLSLDSEAAEHAKAKLRRRFPKHVIQPIEAKNEIDAIFQFAHYYFTGVFEDQSY